MSQLTKEIVMSIVPFESKGPSFETKESKATGFDLRFDFVHNAEQ